MVSAPSTPTTNGPQSMEQPFPTPHLMKQHKPPPTPALRDDNSAEAQDELKQKQRLSLDLETSTTEEHSLEHRPSTHKQGGRQVCGCYASTQVIELLKVNHHWQLDYTALLDRQNQVQQSLHQTQQRLSETQKERTELLATLQQRIVGGETDMVTAAHDSRLVQQDDRHQQHTASPTPSAEDVEALKFQCVVYKEDFESEQKERERVSAENDKLRGQLQRAYTVIDNNKKELDAVRRSNQQLFDEKERIISQLRQLLPPTSPSPTQFVHQQPSPPANSHSPRPHAASHSPRPYESSHSPRPYESSHSPRPYEEMNRPSTASPQRQQEVVQRKAYSFEQQRHPADSPNHMLHAHARRTKSFDFDHDPDHREVHQRTEEWINQVHVGQSALSPTPPRRHTQPQPITVVGAKSSSHPHQPNNNNNNSPQRRRADSSLPPTVLPPPPVNNLPYIPIDEIYTGASAFNTHLMAAPASASQSRAPSAQGWFREDDEIGVVRNNESL